MDRKTGRVLFMTFEHEALHAEVSLRHHLGIVLIEDVADPVVYAFAAGRRRDYPSAGFRHPSLGVPGTKMGLAT